MTPATLALALALSLIWPQPRQAEIAPLTRLTEPIAILAPAELAAPAALLRSELTRRFGPGAVAAEGAEAGSAIRLVLDPGDLPRAEEFALDPGDDGLRLRAHEPQGAFWAVHTLASLLDLARRTEAGWEVPVPKLHDWPETTFRAFMIQGAYGGSIDDFKRNLELLARQRVTYVALEFGPQVVLDLDPSIARHSKFTKAEAREIVDYGRSLGIQPIGYLNLLGHLDRAYQKAPYTQHGGIDVRSDVAYEQFVYPILDEMLEVYGPLEYFHAGMDEAWELFTWLSEQGENVTALLARHIQRINDYFKARGIKLVIWHDMLLARSQEEELGPSLGPANGGPPQNTAGALPQIPRDVILDYWNYTSFPAYPAIDWFRQQGFTVWTSPWQTPFALVRQSLAADVPTMGTLWSGPPGVFSSRIYQGVTALYAQAAWNPTLAPDELTPEAAVREAAERATSAQLWARPTEQFDGQPLRLTPAGPVPLAWPAAATEQYQGVPLVTDEPLDLPPLPAQVKPLADPAAAATVVLPSGQVALDGANTYRGENELILYSAPQTTTGTNPYGDELLVSATGEVLRALGQPRQNDSAIPPGGFVLSVHLGKDQAKARLLNTLAVGDRIGILDAAGQWIGGQAAIQILVNFPNGQLLRPNAVNGPRESDDLVLYQPAYDGGRTGTNRHGLEVMVKGEQVVEIVDGQGDLAIPEDGFVLSAHRGDTHVGWDALEALQIGDLVRLVVDQGGQQINLEDELASRRIRLPVNAPVRQLFVAASTHYEVARDTHLGTWRVEYADGTTARLPVRYGRSAIAAGPRRHPAPPGGPGWLLQAPVRAMVLEWTNDRPDQPVIALEFEPALAILQVGLHVVGATAATE